MGEEVIVRPNYLKWCNQKFGPGSPYQFGALGPNTDKVVRAAGGASIPTIDRDGRLTGERFFAFKEALQRDKFVQKHATARFAKWTDGKPGVQNVETY